MGSQDQVAKATENSANYAVDSAAPKQFIERQLKQSFAENVRPVGYGLSFLYLIFALAHPYALGPKATPLVIGAISSAIVFSLIAFRVEALHLSDFGITIVSLIYVCLVLANSALHLLVTADPKQSTNFMLLIVGAGSFYLSRRKLMIALVMIVAAWWTCFSRLPSRAELVHYSFAMFTAVIIAFLTLALRRRAVVLAAASYWKQQQQLALVEAKDEELQRTNLELENRVLARTIELEQEIERRRNIERAAFEAEKLAATGRMAATIAHEINNPLESVGNLLYLIESNPHLPEQIVGRAQLAQQELGRVSHIAKQTLSFYRESGKPSSFDVHNALREVVELYGPKARSRNLKIDLMAKHDGLTIEGYLGEFRQVASNLLLNAIDATPSGGTIRIRSKPTDGRGRNGVRVTFADSGPGIQRQLRGKIFQPFFTTKEQRGTGLGLWVALGIVSRHGGSIQLASSTRPERHGTCVSVWLPIKATELVDARRRRFEQMLQ